MFNYTVRPAGIADTAAIYRMNVKLFGAALSEERAAKAYRDILIDAEQIILAAVHSGNIVGYIHARQVCGLTEEMHTEVIGIAAYEYYLDKNARSELIAAMVQWSAQILSRFVRFRTGVYDEKLKTELLKAGFREAAHGSLERKL